MSIADQSLLSVPPAPELILSNAPIVSPSLPSMLFNSSSSIHCSNLEIWPSSSSWGASSWSRICKSSNPSLILLYASRGALSKEILRRSVSASLGLSQKPGCCEASVRAFSSFSLLSASKKPPQPLPPLQQAFIIIFVKYHNGAKLRF